MMINPILNEYYGCYEACIATVAKHFQKDFYMMFSACFYFDYKQISDTVANGIDIYPTELYRDKLLYNFHGIQITSIEFTSKQDLLAFITCELEAEYPIMMWTDVYYCNWNVLYNRQHIDHKILITSYENSVIGCIDPYFTQELLMIYADNPLLIWNKLSSFRIHSPKSIKIKVKIQALLVFLYQYRKNHQKTLSFKLFTQDIIRMDLELEKGNASTLYDIPIIRKLKLLEDNRYCYREMLAALEQRYGISFSRLNLKIEQLCLKWHELRMILLKCFLIKSVKVKQEAIIKSLDEIEQFEIDVLNHLISELSRIR